MYQHKNNSRLHSSSSNKSQQRDTQSIVFCNNDFSDQHSQSSQDCKQRFEFVPNDQLEKLMKKDINVNLDMKLSSKKQILKEQYYEKYKQLFQNDKKTTLQKQERDENLCLREMYAFEQLKGQLNQFNEKRTNINQQSKLERENLTKQIQRNHSKPINDKQSQQQLTLKNQGKTEYPPQQGKLVNYQNGSQILMKENNNQTHQNVFSAKFLGDVKQMVIKSQYIEQRDQEKLQILRIPSKENALNKEIKENTNNLNSSNQQFSSIDSNQLWNSVNQSKESQPRVRISSTIEKCQTQSLYQSVDKSIQYTNNCNILQPIYDNTVNVRTEESQGKSIKYITQNFQFKKRPPVVFRQSKNELSQSLNRNSQQTQSIDKNSYNSIDVPSYKSYKNPKKLFRIDLKKIAPKQNCSSQSFDFQKDENHQTSYRSIPMSDISEREAKIKAQKDFENIEIKIKKDDKKKNKTETSMKNNYFTSQSSTSQNINQSTPNSQQSQQPNQTLPDLRISDSKDSLLAACKIGQVISYPQEVKQIYRPILRDKNKYEQTYNAYQEGDITPILTKPGSIRSKDSFSRKSSKVRFANDNPHNRFRSMTEYSQEKDQKISVNKILLDSYIERQKKNVKQQFINLQDNSACSNYSIYDDFFIENSGYISLSENNNNNNTPLKSFEYN